MKKKWRQILSWILTLTMLLGTFQSNGLAITALAEEPEAGYLSIEDVIVGDADTLVNGLNDKFGPGKYNKENNTAEGGLALSEGITYVGVIVQANGSLTVGGTDCWGVKIAKDETYYDYFPSDGSIMSPGEGHVGSSFLYFPLYGTDINHPHTLVQDLTAETGKAGNATLADIAGDLIFTPFVVRDKNYIAAYGANKTAAKNSIEGSTEAPNPEFFTAEAETVDVVAQAGCIEISEMIVCNGDKLAAKLNAACGVTDKYTKEGLKVDDEITYVAVVVKKQGGLALAENDCWGVKIATTDGNSFDYFPSDASIAAPGAGFSFIYLPLSKPDTLGRDTLIEDMGLTEIADALDVTPFVVWGKKAAAAWGASKDQAKANCETNNSCFYSAQEKTYQIPELANSYIFKIYVNDGQTPWNVLSGSLEPLTADADNTYADMLVGTELSRKYEIKSKDYHDTFEASGLEWNVYTTDAGTTQAVAGKDYPAGVSITSSAGTITIGGRVEKTFEAQTVYLIGKEVLNAQSSRIRLIIPVKFGVKPVDVTALPNEIAFTAASEGYVVSKTPVSGKAVVAPEEITLKAVADLSAEYEGVDVSFSIKNEDEWDADEIPFTVSPASGKLTSATPLKVEVAPIEGLAYYTGDGTVYSDKLVISSDAFADIEIPLSFTVKSDLKVSVTRGGEEVEGLDLGDIEVGKEIEPIVIKVTSKSHGVTITPLAEALPAGLNAVIAKGTKQSTLTISGTPSVGAYTWNETDNKEKQAYSFNVKATESSTGAETGGQFELSVKPADVSYADEDGLAFNKSSESLGTGVDSYAYTWGMNTGDSEVKSIQLQVKNNTDVELTLTAELDNSDKFILGDNEPLKVEAGKTGAFVLKTKEGATIEASNTVTVIISGSGIQKAAVKYTVKNVTEGSVITESIPSAEVGKPYAATLKANGGSAGWAIVTSEDDDPNAAAGTKTNESYLYENYGITLNETTGVLSGTPKKAVTNLPIKVRKGSNGTPRQLTLTITAAENALTIAANGKAIGTGDKKLNMGELVYGNTNGVSKAISITDKTGVGLGDLTAEIDRVKYDNGSGPDTSWDTAPNISKYFVLKTLKADGEELTTGSTDNSVTLLESKAYALTVESLGTGAEHLKAGVYTVTVSVGGTNAALQTFEAKVTVKSVFKIGNVSGTFTVGTAVPTTEPDAAPYRYTATKDAESDPIISDVTFSWVGEPDGLSLNAENGQISGTPTESGEFEVTVNVTGTGDNAGISGSASFNLVVAGLTELSVTVSANEKTKVLVNGNDAIVLKGKVVGDARDMVADGFAVKLATSGTDLVAGGQLNISVEAVDTSTDQSVPNPHDGSEGFIGVTKEHIANSAVGSGEYDFYVGPKSTTVAGDYLVKVTISGENVTTFSFYVEYVVSDKLAIEEPEAEGLKTAIGASYMLQLKAENTYGKTLNWYELQAKKGENGWYNYITQDDGIISSGADYREGSAGTTPGTTGLALIEDSDASAIIGRSDPDDKRAVVGIRGDFPITVRVKSIATGGTLKDEQEKLKNRSGATVTYHSVDSIEENLDLNTFDPYADQEFDLSFILKAGKTSSVSVSNVASDANGFNTDAQAAKATSEESRTPDMVAMLANTTFDENNDATIVGYTFKDQSKVYLSAPDETITLTLKNNSGVAMENISMSLSKNDSTGSGFLLAANKIESIAAGGTGTFKVHAKPKTLRTPTPDGYEDVIIITADDMEAIEFPISLKVIDAEILFDAYYDDASVAAVHQNSSLQVVSANQLLNEEGIDLGEFQSGKTDYRGAVKNLYILNAGNIDLDLTVVEVKDADGTPYVNENDTNKKLLIGKTSEAVGRAQIEFDEVAEGKEAKLYFRLADDSNVPGSSTAYLSISYGGEEEVILPVNYFFYDDDLSAEVSPSGTDILMLKNKDSEDPKEKYYAENYDYKDAAETFTVKNDNVIAGAEEDIVKSKTLVGVTVTLSGANKDDFQFIDYGTAKVTGGDKLSIDAIASGESFSFKLAPVEGLRAGSYTATLSFGAENKDATTIEKNVSFRVFDSDVYEQDIYSEASAITAETDRNRLYQSLVVSQRDDILVTTDTATNTVNASINGGSVNVKFRFSGDVTDHLNLTSPDSAEVTRAEGIATDLISVVLEEDDITKIKAKHSLYSAGSDFFTTVNFNILSKVTFVTTNVDSIKNTYAEFNRDNVEITEGAEGTIDKTKNIVVTVPNGKPLASALNDGILPVVKRGDYGFNGWTDDGIVVDGEKDITDDLTLNPSWHTHRYSTNPNESNEAFAKWTWNEDTEGTWTASLVLHCTDGGCMAEDKGELVFTTETDPAVSITNGPSHPVTCTEDGYVTYVASLTYGGVTYVSENRIEEATTGHAWDDAVVTWGDAKPDGSYDESCVSVSRTCTKCEDSIDLRIVSVNASRQEADCEHDGQITYSVTYMDVNAFGEETEEKPATGQELTVPIPARHSNELDIIVEDFNEETLSANVVITCPDCGNKLFEGILRGELKEGTQDVYVFSFVYRDVNYSVEWKYHEHVWENPVWTWTVCTLESASANVTVSCNVNAEKPHSKTVVADMSKTVSGNKLTWTATATVSGQTFTDTKALDTVTGEEWTHDHVWTGPEWVWTGSVSTDDIAVTGIFTCSVSADDIHTLEIEAEVASTSANGVVTCTATLTGPDGETYTVEKQFDAVTGEEITHEHVWEGPVWEWSGSVSKNDVAAKATFTCSVSADKVHSEIVDAKVTSVSSDGIITYTATVSFNGSNYSDTKRFDWATGEEVTHEHVWEGPVWEWSGSVSKNDVAAKATFTCSVSADKVHSETVDAKVTSVSSDGIITYTATVSFNGSNYSDTKRFDWATGEEITHEDVWGDPVWTWAGSVSTNNVSAKATFTCTVVPGKPHSEVVDAVISSVSGDGVVVCTATAVFKGNTYTDTRIFDAGKGDEVNDKKLWSKPVWDWTGTTSTNAVAKATFTCTVSADTPVTKTVNADKIEIRLETKDYIYYVAEVSFEGTSYTDEYAVNKTSGKGADVPVNGIGIGIEGLEESYDYTGIKIKPSFIVVDYDCDKVLAETTDYTVSYGANKNAGLKAGSVTITGKGNYAGKTVTETFDIVDRAAEVSRTDMFDLKGAKIKNLNAVIYNGEEQHPAFTLELKGGTSYNYEWDGSEYVTGDAKTPINAVVTLANNVKKGSATILLTGKDVNGKATVLKKAFSIKPVDLSKIDTDDLKLVEAGEAIWSSKGAVPSYLNLEYVTENGKVIALVQGQDYSAKYTYASKKKDAGTGAASITIAGKGNFSKKFGKTFSFDISKLELTDENVSVAAYAGMKAKTAKITVYDGCGKAVALSNLDVKIFKEGTDSDLFTTGTKLEAGATYTVEVEPKNGEDNANISGKATIVFVAAANLSKAKVVGISGKGAYYAEFTGEEIRFEDMEVNPFETGAIKIQYKVNGSYVTLKYGEDYEISGYANNLKKGSMSVTIRGISKDYSGVKTFKVKIAAKQMKKAK
ncbi:MAG: Ig domain-containing protein [Lachnospiraceae bacterium]|nr:Ig domain-containing protein [Lachnospiraceae bacterium]